MAADNSPPPSDGERSIPKSGVEELGMSMVFKDISYRVRNSANKKETLTILEGVTGFFRAGEVTALMGPSGSGKTTLLDILAGRKTAGTIGGDILYGGGKGSSNFLRRYTGYVEQFDTLHGNLSVRENLMFSCEMRSSTRESLESKTARVESLLSDLALSECANVRVGTALARGVSGGQAKRCNIGIALVGSPRVLFLDEPTTGLDSYTGHEVTECVVALARRGITVCATIHSPSPQTFALFDRLHILLAGRTAYAGPNGDPALAYFRAHLAPSPDGPTFSSTTDGLSAIEWMTDVVVGAARAKDAPRVAAAYEKSLQAQETAEEAEVLIAGDAADPRHATARAVKRATETPAWFGVKILTKYRARADAKDPAYVIPRLAEKVLVGFVLFTLYWHTGKDLTEGNVPNIVALLFMWTTVVGYSAASYVPSLIMERPIYTRERSDGMYRPVTYLSFKLAEEYVLQLIASPIIALIIWKACALRGSYTLFWLMYYATILTAVAVGYFFSAIAPNMEFANAALPLFVTLMLFFTGLLIRWDDAPHYWRWLTYVDFLHYSWGALMVNQFSGTDASYMGYPILPFFSLDGANMWLYLLYQFLFAIFFAIATWLGLAYMRHGRR